MELPKEVKDRIWKDGINFSADVKQRVSYINGAAKEAERAGKLVAALEAIANPIKHLRDEATKKGMQFDGAGAISVASDPSFLKSLAEKAINEYNQQP